ncbi:Ca2+/Na+ antiporter [Mycoplasmoides fastidiosum]|uniref:Ca2+/Na+ antiporter n=1 Tax=Mycoplasmoides fastidiosum TaxID=92758 RepID=A0ABU0LYC1_9BACT|nr:hypothetical protein [Mycoplasmoides fastidiosum]MDQ0513711.1 Ca2+/Na+ antiporter [Mycoplasmoides fastidiosum]UUD37866.1 hypothetical protein NPA10_00515 [Mycoplasmoides fastidiosum]
MIKNNIGGVPFANYLWDGYQIIAWFLLFSSIVIFAIYFIVKYIKIITVKLNISVAFIGGIILPVVTSLPEFFTGFFGASIDRISHLPTGVLFSLYNVTGANAIQIFILSIFGVYLFIWWYKQQINFHKKIHPNQRFGVFTPFKKKKGFASHQLNTQLSQNENSNVNENQQLNQFYLTNWSPIIRINFLLWVITFVEYFVMLLFLLVPSWGQVFNIGGFSFINFLFFLTWLSYLIYSYKFNPESEDLYSPYLEKSWAWKINPKLLIFVIFLMIPFLSFSAYLNSGIVENFDTVLKIPKSAAASFFLSLATSLPEISMFISLASKRLFVTAASGILGSSVFNLSIPFYSNLVSLNPLYGDKYTEMLAIRNPEAILLIPWLILSILLYVFIALAMWKKANQKAYIAVPLIFFLAAGYIVGFMLISTSI